MKHIRKIICIAVLFILIVGAASFVTFASEESSAQKVQPRVLLDGDEIMFDVPPMIDEGRMMVPFRYIFEALGYEDIQWNEASLTVVAKSKTSEITLVIGEKKLFFNGEEIELDAAPRIVSGRTLVPLRAVSECSGCDVLWNNEKMTALLYHRQSEATVVPRSTYQSFATDGQYIYVSITGYEQTYRFPVDGTEVEPLPIGLANDYIVYKDILYGRFMDDLHYGSYDPETGKAVDLSGENVADGYIYNDQIYYMPFSGMNPSRLFKMNLDGSGKVMVAEGFHLWKYFIQDDLIFNEGLVIGFDGKEKINLLDEDDFFFTSALYGDCYYVASASEVGRDQEGLEIFIPNNIVVYNYKTGLKSSIPCNVRIEELIVTENSIYYAVPEENRHNIVTLYRMTKGGEYSVKLMDGIWSEIYLIGNNLYLSSPDIQMFRLSTDGSRIEEINYPPKRPGSA